MGRAKSPRSDDSLQNIKQSVHSRGGNDLGNLRTLLGREASQLSFRSVYKLHLLDLRLSIRRDIIVAVKRVARLFQTVGEFQLLQIYQYITYDDPTPVSFPLLACDRLEVKVEDARQYIPLWKANLKGWRWRCRRKTWCRHVEVVRSS